MRTAARYWWVGGIAGLWAGGLLLVTVYDDDTPGLFIAIMGAVATAVAFMRHWTLRTRQAFIHGFHAGWHAGHKTEGDCLAYPCDIIDFATERRRRLERLTG